MKVYLKPGEAIQALNNGKVIHYQSDVGEMRIKKIAKTVFEFTHATEEGRYNGAIRDVLSILNNRENRMGLYTEIKCEEEE